MTFEEEFEKFKLTAGASPKHKKIINHFKDWQPQQALQEVPQFVADWFDENKGDLEFGIYCENLNINNKPERELSTIEKFF
ncbi:hypothetical protein [Lactococcus fujiensis]|nr:hypothetical protein [Lactococcus fujiensis]